MTPLMTWISPLQALMSAEMILGMSWRGFPARFWKTPFPRQTVRLSLPLAISILFVQLKSSEESFFPPTAWKRRMLVKVGMSSRSASTIPSGRSPKASSVGAKTVKVSLPSSTSPKPAAVTAAQSVPKPSVLQAISAIVWHSWFPVRALTPPSPAWAMFTDVANKRMWKKGKKMNDEQNLFASYHLSNTRTRTRYKRSPPQLLT